VHHSRGQTRGPHRRDGLRKPCGLLLHRHIITGIRQVVGNPHHVDKLKPQSGLYQVHQGTRIASKTMHPCVHLQVDTHLTPQLPPGFIKGT